MQQRVNDLLDKPNDPVAGRLRSELQGLEDDLQVGKQANSIEARVRRIMDILEGPAKDAQIMNYQHIDMLYDWFDGLLASVQKLR